METIRCYRDTENDLKVVNLRIEVLESQKYALNVKYLGVKSPNLENPLDMTSFENNSKVVAYLNALEVKKQKNGMSIQEELENLYNERKMLLKKINEMQECLNKLKGIEYKIYYKIIVDGKNVTKAIYEVCEENDISEMTGWRKYHKIKKMVEGK